jgi:hypothetical protein
MDQLHKSSETDCGSKYEKLQHAASEYLYQAHNQTLADITDCDHVAGVCWCDYILAFVNLRNILNEDRSP